MTDIAQSPRAPRKAPARKAPAAVAPVRRRGAAARPRVAGKAETEALAARLVDVAEPGETPAVGRAAAAKATRPTVTWRGRTMAVQLPSDAQLAVLQRTYDRLAHLSQGDLAAMDGDKGSKLLSRVLSVVLVTIADEGDRDWIEDRILADALVLNDVAPLVPQAIDAIRAHRGDGAPRTGPASRARRRA